LALAATLGWTRPAHAQVGIAVHVPFVSVGLYSNPYVYPVYGVPVQWGPYPYPYPYPFHPPADPGAAIRLEVKPREAEVYVDGFYAGVVDDFDGTFQRLRVPPGEHTITLYLDGYHSVTQKVNLEPDNTFRIKYVMQKLGANEPAEARPVQPNPPQEPMPQGGFVQPGEPRPMPPARRGPPPRPMPPPENHPNAAPAPGAAGYGTLAIRVQPGDAEILIDGQPWHGSTGSDQLLVEVAGGRHAVDIRKSGYIGYVTEVQVRPGETTPLNVSLRNQNDR